MELRIAVRVQFQGDVQGGGVSKCNLLWVRERGYSGKSNKNRALNCHYSSLFDIQGEIKSVCLCLS